jgi:hypothetical protein
MLYINQFRKDNGVPATFTVEYYPYNWALNDQQPADVTMQKMAGK